MEPYITTRFGVSRIHLDYSMTKVELLELLNNPIIPGNASLDYEMGYYDEISITLSWLTRSNDSNS